MRPLKYQITESSLRDMYSEQKLPPEKIAEVIGCTRATVYHYLKRFGIENIPKYERLEGQRFGRLVVSELLNGKKTATWKCLCDCGNTTTATTSRLKFGRTQSCGCLSRDTSSTHRMAHSRPYSIWQGMKTRCDNPKAINYHSYGGRGIGYDPRWSAFESFWADMEEGYSDGLTLDRRDNSLGYCKENCRWIKPSEQNLNMRSNVILTARGQSKTIKEWADELNADSKRMYCMHSQGVSDAEIVGMFSA